MRRDLLITILIVSAMLLGSWLFFAWGVFLLNSQISTQEMRQLIDQKQELALIEGNTLVGVSSVYYPKVRTLGYIANDIISCESKGVHEVWGDLDYKYPAYGIAQFQERTFYWLAGLAGEELDWKNEADQRWLLGWALENGYGYLWSCYRIVN